MQKALQQTVTEYQLAQKELEKTNISRRKIVTQISENDMVNQELLLLTPDTNVYKLIGPALIKQESSSAQANVAKRLEYLKSEAARLEQVAKDYEKQIAAKKEAIMQMQAIQQQQINQAQKK